MLQNVMKKAHSVSGGFGPYGVENDLRLHLRLRDACTSYVTVRWLDDNLSEQVYKVSANQHVKTLQGEKVDAP